MSPPRENQIKFDYEREQRERRQLIWAVAPERTGLSLRKWANVQTVLIFLVGCDRGDGTFPYRATIAKACHMKPRTVDRAIADAKAIGILSSRFQKNRSGRASNEWSIDFAAIASLGTGNNRRQNGENHRQDGNNRRQNGENPYKEYNYSSSLPNASSTSSDLTQQPGVIRNEEEEEVLLKKFISSCRSHHIIKQLLPMRFEQAACAAISNGCSIDQLFERLTWFGRNRGAWHRTLQKGAVYSGLSNATPDLPVDQGWPSRCLKEKGAIR